MEDQTQDENIFIDDEAILISQLHEWMLKYKQAGKTPCYVFVNGCSNHEFEFSRVCEELGLQMFMLDRIPTGKILVTDHTLTLDPEND